MGIGDWGLGIGDWGLGIGDWAQSPIPNPQSPIPLPNPPKIHYYIALHYLINFLKKVNNENITSYNFTSKTDELSNSKFPPKFFISSTIPNKSRHNKNNVNYEIEQM